MSKLPFTNEEKLFLFELSKRVKYRYKYQIKENGMESKLLKEGFINIDDYDGPPGRVKIDITKCGRLVLEMLNDSI